MTEKEDDEEFNTWFYDNRNWFDRLFPTSGFAGYRPTYAFTHPHKIIEFAMDEIKYAWQRVFRGWDDRVIWSIDIYLTEKIPLWLLKLKEDKQGVPINFFKDGVTEFTDEEVENARIKWNAELDTMIRGFAASKKIQDSEYKNDEDFEFLKSEFEKGMKSFTENYFSLWN